MTPPTVTAPAADARQLVLDVELLAEGVVADAAEQVDRDAAFPLAALSAARERRLLAAAIPVADGGLGLDVHALAAMTQRLARACGSTAMVLAMHHVQVACIAAHGRQVPRLAACLGEIAERQLLVASVTSEVGVGGDLRRSVAALEPDGERWRLVKQAPTVSYGAHADAFLITARRATDAPPSDQVAVLAMRDEVELEPADGWDTLGMRGTCSPAFGVVARVEPARVLPVPFGTIAAATMVPLSHILWSACWTGLAEEALRRATRSARERRRASADGGADLRLAEAARAFDLMEAQLDAAIRRYGPAFAEGRDPSTPTFTAQLNNLKVSAATLGVEVAQRALEVCGMAGYAERSPLSIARILRDLYSARLMIANERLLATNAHLRLLGDR